MVLRKLTTIKILFLISCIILSFNNSSSYAAISCITSYSPTRNVNIGMLDPYNYTNIVIPVKMTITCSTDNSTSGNITYTYGFDGGSSGNMNNRNMKYESSIVKYGVCTSSNCTQNYGNGSNGTFSVSKSYYLARNDSQNDSWNLYFVVPVQPLSVPGTYTDTINVSLTVTY